MQTSRLSTKGQIIVPKSIRDEHAWTPGTELAFEETSEGVLLRPISAFPPSTLEQVLGCLNYTGKAKTIADMDKGVVKEARRRHASGRY